MLQEEGGGVQGEMRSPARAAPVNRPDQRGRPTLERRPPPGGRLIKAFGQANIPADCLRETRKPTAGEVPPAAPLPILDETTRFLLPPRAQPAILTGLDALRAALLAEGVANPPSQIRGKT